MSLYSEMKQEGMPLFYYDGRLKNAPNELRHIFRDLGVGEYLIYVENGIIKVVPVAIYGNHEQHSDLLRAVVTHWYIMAEEQGLFYMINQGHGYELISKYAQSYLHFTGQELITDDELRTELGMNQYLNPEFEAAVLTILRQKGLIG